MEKKTIREAYADFFKALSLNSVAAAKIDSSNVYQLANPKNRKLMDKLVEDNLLPESHLENVENFLDFYNQVKSGKSGLILMEHYSNTDLPALLYMLDKWLLIENLKMSESDAHYYIEKQAMDTRLSRREVAQGIIRTYDK